MRRSTPAPTWSASCISRARRAISSSIRIGELISLARGRVETCVVLVNPDNTLRRAGRGARRPTGSSSTGPRRRIASRRSATKPGIAILKACPIGDGRRRRGGRRALPTPPTASCSTPRPPKGADRPGGLGVTFDWSLLKALDPALPFMLSGGLTPDTVAAAIRSVRPFGRRRLLGGRNRAGRQGCEADRRIHHQCAAGRGELVHECHRERRGPGQFPAQRPGRRGPFRHLWRPLRRRDADAADPRSRGGLSRRAGRSRPMPPSSRTSRPTMSAGPRRSITPSG